MKVTIGGIEFRVEACLDGAPVFVRLWCEGHEIMSSNTTGEIRVLAAMLDAAAESIDHDLSQKLARRLEDIARAGR